MKVVVLATIALALLAAACGSSSSDSEKGPSADEVEAALAENPQAGGGVVDLDQPPKLIVCEKGEGPMQWRCRLAAAKGGRTIICMVTTDPETRTISKKTCAPVDY